MNRFKWLLMMAACIPLSGDDFNANFKIEDVAKTARIIYACGRIQGMKEIAERLTPGATMISKLEDLAKEAGCQDKLLLMDSLDELAKKSETSK